MLTISGSFVGKAKLLQKKKKRIIYPKEKLMLTKGFQLKDVSFYPDGVSFVCKLYPKGEIRAYGSREQRKEGEGLRITAKRKKEGVDGRTVHLFAAIAYGKGVICEQFLGK